MLAQHTKVEEPSQHHSYNTGVFESAEYRDTFFRKVLAALNAPAHPASRVTILRIINMQNHIYAETAESDDFRAVLSRLKTLELCIAKEENEAAPEVEIQLPELHKFFSQDLLRYWLGPVQENLVHLKLCKKLYEGASGCSDAPTDSFLSDSQDYWGYNPKCDLGSLHFPISEASLSET